MMAQDELVVAGIDVAKDKIDVCIRSQSSRCAFASTTEGRRELASWLRRRKVGKVVMEAFGGYEREWAKTLGAAKIEVRIVDPKRVRSFARSAGRLAKNDIIDAEMIAWFAETFAEAPHQAYDAERERLAQIVNARQALLDLQTDLQNRSEHSVPDVVQRVQARLLKKIAAELVTLEAAITAAVKATPQFAELAELIESVPGLARITSASLIAAMPELGQVSNKVAAALLGVAPYDDDSGKRRGERLSRRSYAVQPGAQGLLSASACQGKGAEGGARRLHAQADRHSQHPDRTPAKMGSQPLRAELSERT
jgi:transposase